MNEPPVSGILEVNPRQGLAFDTAFSFTALTWVDEDLPLSYRFGTLPVYEDGSFDLSMTAPFGGDRRSAIWDGVTLSAGSNPNNFTVGCFVDVIDYYGAEGFGTTSTRVFAKPLSLGALRNISEAKVRAALESHDADAAKQILHATLGSMDATSTSGSNGRRRLLATPEYDSSALLASVLSNLWATYEITPVTQADVASLLNSLVGVVDTPSCTNDIAVGALDFLSTVR